MLVGEGPGATEDETGRPFVGRPASSSTQILERYRAPAGRVYSSPMS